MSINPNFRDAINFRDLGGYPTLDGRVIKNGLLYRSGGIYLMNSQELDYFRSLNIKYIMDLRTREESLAMPNPVLSGIQMVRHSGLVFRGGEEIDFSPVGMSKIGQEGEEQFNALYNYYCEMPFDNQAFRILMNEVLKGNAPLVFHCATGKDRTGVAAMIVLSALGVPKGIVLEDYLLSNMYHRATIDQALLDSKSEIAEHPILGELVSMRTGVSPKIGSAVLDEIHNRYGTLESYLEKEFFLGPSELADLRNYYLLP